MLTVGGIPAHPLVVHAVVVILPLAALGTLAIAARPAWRRQLGVWVLLLGIVGVGAVPLAKQTGERANLGMMDYADMIDDGPDRDAKVEEIRDTAALAVL